MIELRTLGAVELHNADGTELRSVLVQPKRTALLVYLAVAARRGFHRRDSLLGLFWPDQDAAHARGALRQALHGLRHALGEGVLVGRGDEEVALDPTRCRCDIWAFEEAIERGDLEAAVALYRGAFLEGFFLSGGMEFERWVEAERERVSRRYAAALEQLGEAAEAAGGWPTATEWWSRLAHHVPYASRIAIRLMRALEAAGDRAGAIQHAEQHTERLQADLEAKPDPDVEALATRLRAQPTSATNLAVPPLASASVHPAADVRRAARPAFPRRRAMFVAGLLLIVVAGWWTVGAVGAGTHAMHRLAVLPLANYTGDSTQQYFVEGMHEAMITELAQLRSLSVISRTSVMRYQDTRPPLPQIARELQVDAIVEGGVFLAGDSIRITVQLIDARGDRHLWARTFEGDLRHVLSLSRDAAQAIARGVRVTLTPEESARLASARPVDPEAHIAYLQGRWHWHRYTRDGVRRSIAFFQHAIARDPAYAPAYAGLADAYIILGHYYDAPGDMFPKARAAAEKALELDESLAEAHAALGHIAFEHDWDWREAERAFRRAIELNPSDASAHHIFGGGFLVAMGRFDEAQAEMTRAYELDPLSPTISKNRANPYLYAGAYDRAVPLLQETINMFPEEPGPHQTLGYAYAMQGRYRDAIAEFERGHSSASLFAYAYGRAGERTKAESLLTGLLEQARQTYVSPIEIAGVYVGLGDRERALEWLERAHRERVPQVAWLKVLPQFVVPLGSEPRFQELLRRLEFPDN